MPSGDIWAWLPSFLEENMRLFFRVLLKITKQPNYTIYYFTGRNEIRTTGITDW